MSGQLINMRANCRKCYQPLQLKEIHYYANGDGTATCEKCETEWMEAIANWRASSDDKPMPERP